MADACWPIAVPSVPERYALPEQDRCGNPASCGEGSYIGWASFTRLCSRTRLDLMALVEIGWLCLGGRGA